METTVPAGHEVTLFSMAVEPGVHVTAGNVIIASLGVAGDDGDRELAEVLAAVDKALERKAEATLVEHDGPLQLADLFEPNTPKTMKVESPVTWVLHDGNVISTMASETQRTTLIMFMHKLARAGVKQAVYFIDPPEPCVAIFAQHMIGIGAVMRQPDPHDGELVIQIEVKRPDGVLTVLAGSDVPLDGLTRVYEPHSLNALAPQVIKTRVEKLIIKEQPIAFRAPKLRARMLEQPDAGVFLDELLSRDLPLFVMRKPDTEALDVRAFGDVRALPVYIDVISLHWAAADQKLAPGSFAPAPADIKPLLKHVMGGELGLAIGAFKDRGTPIYAVLPADMLASTAQRLRL
jgi:hypothetical protein